MFPSAHRAAHRQLCTWLRTEVDARQRSIENTFERDVQKLEMAVRRKVSVYKGKLSERETEASRYEATIDDALGLGGVVEDCYSGCRGFLQRALPL